MALPKYYSTGLISIANGATSFTGSGTAWLNLIKADDRLTIQGYSVRIASIASNGAGTLAQAWPGTTVVNGAYEIEIVFDGPEFQLRTRQLLEQLNVLETSGRGIVSTYDEATTDSDPGNGIFKLNGLPAVATRLYLDNLDIGGADISAEIDTWDDSANTTRGRLWMRSIDVPATFYSYDVTGSIADGTGYRKVTLTYVGGSGTLADGDEVTFFFTPHGEKGDGLDWDARTATLAGLLDYENQAVGYRVLVDDNGTGRSAVYELENSGSPTDWSDPIYVSGEAATVAVGTTTTLAAGASATVTNTGNSKDAVFAFGIPQGSGLDFDVQVDTLAGLLDYENQAVGYRVLVSDVGDGRAAVYILENSGSPTDWSNPSYVTGDSGTTVVATRTAMKALNTVSVDVAYLTESGREGIFVWRTGDYSTQITADTQEGIYIKADAIAATAGAWVRVYEGARNVKWFGALGDGTGNDATAIQKAIDLISTGAVYLPKGNYRVTAGITVPAGITLLGDGDNATIIDGSATDVVTVTVNGMRSGIEKIAIYGKGVNNDTGVFGATNHALKVNGVENIVRDVLAWGGNYAIHANGVDGLYENVNANQSYGLGLVVSNGANWFVRDKFDHSPTGVANTSTQPYAAWAATTAYTVGQVVTTGGYAIQCVTAGTSGAAAPTLKNYGINMADNTAVWQLWSPVSYAGLYLGDDSGENHYVQCDWSGAFSESVVTNASTAGNGPRKHVFTDCVMSDAIKLQRGDRVEFKGCNFGQGITVEASFAGSLSLQDNILQAAGKTISIAAGVSNFSIIGNDLNGGTVSVAAGASDQYIIMGNYRATVSDGGTGNNKSVGANGKSSAFSAHKNGVDQTGVADVTFTQVTFGTEVYDRGGNFAANGWTPPAGPVTMSAAALLSGTWAAGSQIALAIFKNGAAYKQANWYSAAANIGGAFVAADDVANGTDVYTLQIFVDVTSGTATISGSSANTYFCGHTCSL